MTDTAAPSLRQAARIAGLNVRTVEGWRAQGLVEPDPDGGWSPEALLEVAADRARGSSDPEAARWAIERLKWQAKSERLKHDALADSLISREEVHESRAAQVRVLRESLPPLGGRVAGRIAATTDRGLIAKVITEAVLEVIAEYSRDPG